MAGLFHVVFVGHSFPIDSAACVQTSATQWTLDVSAMVNTNFLMLKEVCLALSSPNAIDATAGLGLYVSVGGSEWQYRGGVYANRPSDVFPIQVSWRRSINLTSI